MNIRQGGKGKKLSGCASVGARARRTDFCLSTSRVEAFDRVFPSSTRLVTAPPDSNEPSNLAISSK